MDVPPYDNAAMDGYAVRSRDIDSATKDKSIMLKVIGKVAAGQVPDKRVIRKTAIRIMTGAIIPEGADAVVPFELTDEHERRNRHLPPSEIGILHSIPKKTNIRNKGEDISIRQVVLTKGTSLGVAEVGTLASIGISHVAVFRRPVVSVLPTGDELGDIHDPLPFGKIYNSNAYTIAAGILSCGGMPQILGIGRDSVASIRSIMAKGLNSDMLITIGGVSRGDHDVIRDVLAELGRVKFCAVRMNRLKPLTFGSIKNVTGGELPILGLPGNPSGCMTTFEQFARPAILKMMGQKYFVAG
jgi:molybdopterin molybdotransferase